MHQDIAQETQKSSNPEQPVLETQHTIAHSCAGFCGVFTLEHGRKPTDQEIWNHAIRSWRDLNPVTQPAGLMSDTVQNSEQLLREALRPFAICADAQEFFPERKKWADDIAVFTGICSPTMGDLRKARKALAAQPAKPAEPAEPVAWRVRRLDAPNFWIIFMHYPVDAMNDPEREVQPLYIAQPAKPAEPVAWRVRRLDSPDYWIIFLHYPVGSMKDPEREVQPLYISHPEQTAKPASIEIDFKQVTELLQMFGGEPTLITLIPGDGHSGKGLYAYYTEISDEGAEYLGEADDEATPISQPEQPADTGPWQVDVWSGKNEVVIQSHQLKHDAALIINGDFSDADEKRAYADALCAWMNGKVKQESSVIAEDTEKKT